MLVDDDCGMREYLEHLLSQRFSVQLAADGAEAYRLAVEAQPDIVVADVSMPGMDGLGLLRELRRDERTRAMPVILVSARADPESTMAALELGADDYITEPFGPHELVMRVETTLQNSLARAEAGESRGRALGLQARDGELRALVNQLRAAQRRVTVAADLERRRIERDLHDGAQQRLLSMRIELGIAKELIEQDPRAASAKIDELRAAADDALEELRELAQGVYPSLLASDGVGAALLAVARRMPIPVAMEASGIGRAPRAIESAAYFCCLEALQNAVKHAGPDARVALRLTTARGMLEFRVRDDGVGFDARRAARGRGLLHLRDRVSALGGQVEIVSAPGAGTEVSGRIPLP